MVNADKSLLKNSSTITDCITAAEKPTKSEKKNRGQCYTTRQQYYRRRATCNGNVLRYSLL